MINGLIFGAIHRKVHLEHSWNDPLHTGNAFGRPLLLETKGKSKVVSRPPVFSSS